MSLRPAPWPIFGASASRRASAHTGRSRRERPTLTLVERDDRSRLERLSPRARLIAMFVGISMALFAVVAFHVVLSQGQFSLERLQAKADDQQAQYERLRLQVAQLESPDRITSEAQDRLGMVPADNVTPVTPGPSDISKGPAASAPTVPATASGPGHQDWTSLKPYLNSTVK